MEMRQFEILDIRKANSQVMHIEEISLVLRDMDTGTRECITKNTASPLHQLMKYAVVGDKLYCSNMKDKKIGYILVTDDGSYMTKNGKVVRMDDERKSPSLENNFDYAHRNESR